MIPASGLALGSIPAEVLVVVSVLAALACGLLSMGGEERLPSRASRLVLLALGIMVGMTVLQAVPLPHGVTRFLAPYNAEIWERVLSPLKEPGPAWHSISVAPAATRIEVLKGMFYGCVFLGGLRIAALEHGERFLLRVVVGSALLMAISALAHMAVGAERVFGVYRPRELYAYRVGRLTPLLNTNHLAAYLNIGAIVGLWALIARRAIPRPLSASAVLVLAATSVWQASRGAAGTLALGVVLTLALTLYTRKRFGSARANAAVLAACTVTAAFMVSIALSDIVGQKLVNTDLTKVDVAKSSLRLVISSPWLGVGRGGFESVFSSVRAGTSYVTFTHPEDILVQWVTEWGIPISLLSMGILAWALRPQLLLRAARPIVGAWVAVLVSVLHDLADFHLEAPGVVALATVCVALVVSGRATLPETGRAGGPTPARTIAVAMIAGTAVAISSAWPVMSHSLAQDRRMLSAMSIDKGVTNEQFRADARAAMLRYPAEPFLPLMGAVRAQVTDDPGVVPWIARAIERSPRFGRAHFVLARSLGATRAAQARLEYRLAYEYDDGLREAVVREGVQLVVDASSALDLVPEGPAGIPMLDALVAALASRLPSTAVILDEERERRAPGGTAPLRRRAEAAVSDAIDGAPWCERTRVCMAEAVAMTDELARREPLTCHSHVLVARLGLARREVTTALDRLHRATETVTDRAACQRELIGLALGAGQTRRADVEMDALLRAGCGATAECIELYSWAAASEESRGHYVRAVRLYRRVLELTPDRDDLLERIGVLGDRDGLLAEGLDAYNALASRHPGDPRWPARIAELRARLRPVPGGPGGPGGVPGRGP